jgi:hypothetical protein
MPPAIALAAALATLQPAHPAQSPESEALPIAQLEREPEEIVRQLFGEMSRIVYPILPIEQRSLPIRGVRALHFYTRPYGAGLAGICQTDRLVVLFEPELGSTRREDRPVRPTRFHLYSNSYFVGDLARARTAKSIMKAAVPLSIRARCQ